MLSAWGCSDDPVEGVPEVGTVSIRTTWPEGVPVPQKYVVEIGDRSAELSGLSSTFPEKFSPNMYRVKVYNRPAGIGFDGTLATIPQTDGYVDPQPEWFYFYTQELTVQKNEDHEVTAVMAPQVRQLNIAFDFPDGDPGLIEQLEGEISGIAASVDMMTGNVSGQTSVRLPLTRSGNRYETSILLAGIIPGADQTLTLRIKLPDSGMQELTGSLNKILADFNGNKTKSFDVDIDVIGLQLESMDVEVAGWKEGTIRDATIERKPAEKQLTIVWKKEVETITGIEIIDDEGNTFASAVEQGTTTGLYELPYSVKSVYVYQEGFKKDALIRFQSYDREQARIVFGGDTYFVRTPQDLLNVRDDLYGTYVQMNDIDLAGVEWQPIGYYWNTTTNTPFAGSYDGGGFKIENLSLDTETFVSGLFAYNKGTIKNVNIVSGTLRGTRFVAAVCGYNHGTVENCTNAASVTATEEVAGGIIGINGTGGVLRGCTNTGIIKAIGQWTQVSGGVTGENYGLVENCENEGAISGEYVHVAGICGYNGGTLLDCHNRGPITSKMGEIAGVAGYNDDGMISGCSNSGPITCGGNYAAGIVCNSRGTSMIENCINYASGTVSVDEEQAAGIVADLSHGGGYASIMGCVNYADITAGGKVGGIVGSNDGMTAGCANFGNITCTGDGWGAGGIAGTNYFTVAACYNTGEVHGYRQVGGISGANFRSGCNLVASYTLGTVVTGEIEVGTLCGCSVGSANILQCYYNSGTEDEAVGEIQGSASGIYTHYRFWSPDYPEGSWPVEDPQNGWGIVSAEHGPMDLYMWLNLGDKEATPILYPQLWWETTTQQSFGMPRPTVTMRTAEPADLFNRVLGHNEEAKIR